MTTTRPKTLSRSEHSLAKSFLTTPPRRRSAHSNMHLAQMHADHDIKVTLHHVDVRAQCICAVRQSLVQMDTSAACKPVRGTQCSMHQLARADRMRGAASARGLPWQVLRISFRARSGLALTAGFLLCP